MHWPVTAFLVQGLRQESRSLAGHLLRGLVLGTTLLALIGGHFTAWQQGAAGLTTFSALLWLNAFWIWVAAGFFFAGCITAEREEGTLSLLRLTGMSTLSLLLGKIGHRMVATAVLLVGQFPFALLAVTLGGVSPEQVVAGFITLGAYLLVASSIGVFCSTLFPSHLLAALLTLVTLALFPLLAWLYPLSHLDVVLTSDEPTGTALVVLRSVPVALVFLGLAWARLSAITHERPAVAMHGSVRRAGGAARRVRVRGARALMWKERQYNVGGTMGLGLRALAYAILVAGIPWIAARGQASRVFSDLDLWIETLHGVGVAGLMLETALMTGRIIRPEISERSLPGVAILPFSVHRLLLWKTLGCYTGALLPLSLLLVGGLLWSLRALGRFDELPGAEFGLELTASVLFWLGYLLLVLFLSLFLRWGAWLVAFFVWSIAFNLLSLAWFVIAFVTSEGIGAGTGTAPAVVVGALLSVLILWGIYMFCVARLRFLIYG